MLQYLLACSHYLYWDFYSVTIFLKYLLFLAFVAQNKFINLIKWNTCCTLWWKHQSSLFMTHKSIKIISKFFLDVFIVLNFFPIFIHFWHWQTCTVVQVSTADIERHAHNGNKFMQLLYISYCVHFSIVIQFNIISVQTNRGQIRSCQGSAPPTFFF